MTTAATVKLVCSAASVSTDRACARLLHEVFARPRLVLPPSDVGQVLHAFAAAKRWDLALHGLQTLEGAGHGGRWRFSVAAWGPNAAAARDLLRHDPLDGDKAFALITSCRPDYASAEAEAVVRDMAAAGVPLEPRHYSSLMRCYRAPGEFKAQGDVLDRAVAAGAVNAHVQATYIALCAVSARTSPADAVASAERVWAAAMQAGPGHMRHRWLWVNMLKMYRNAGDARGADALQRLRERYAEEHKMDAASAAAFERIQRQVRRDRAGADPTERVPSAEELLTAFDADVLSGACSPQGG
eukprot:TRINITY_DN22677_c0_g1_i1.p1 TRINITY_DN22677_c0_g1~~TRINITY_DN22677_c0_g1_i1.p1  ORF type:complete len:299 (+),score=87.95 TRINITY_DN22677_c0_g1_i1:78-974(+)